MKKVLIVEDNRYAADNFARILKNRGCEVICVETVKDAQEQIQAHPDIHAILMDGSVAGNPYDTTGLVKEIRQTSNVLIIGMSGSTDSLKALRKAGCTETCPKDQLHEEELEGFGVFD